MARLFISVLEEMLHEHRLQMQRQASTLIQKGSHISTEDVISAITRKR